MNLNDLPNEVTPPEETNAALDALPSSETPAEQAYHSVKGTNPNDAAQILLVAKKTGKPVQFVAENFADVDMNEVKLPQSFWNELDKQYPNTSKWLSNPHNMAVASDDFDNLPLFERYYTEATFGFRQGRLTQKLSDLRGKQMDELKKTGKISRQYEADINIVKGELSGMEGSAPKGFHPIYNFANQLPNWIGGAASALKVGAPAAGVGALTALGLGQLGPQALIPEEVVTVPGAAIAFGKGGAAAGAGLYAYNIERNLAFDQYADLKDKNGKPLDPKTAAEAAELVGTINGMLETVGDVVLFKGIAQPIGKGAVAALSKVPGAAKVLGYIQKNPAVFAKMTMRQAVQQAVKTLVLTEVGEISTEYAQEVVTGAGQNLAIGRSGQDIAKTPTLDILSRAGGVISPTAQAVLIPGLIGGSFNVYNSKKAIAVAEQNAQAFTAMTEATKNSETFKRLPEAYQELVNEATKDGPIDGIWIRPAALENHLSKQGIDIAQALAEIGIDGKLYQEAQEMGDLKIPMSQWAKVVRSQQFAGIAADIRLHQEDLSVNEAKELEAEVKKREAETEKGLQEMVKQGEAATEKDAQAKADWTKVHSLVKAELESVGMKTEQADKNAKMWAAWALTQAKATGKTVDQILESRPGITATTQAASQRLNQFAGPNAMTDSPEFKAWFGDSKVVDEKGQPLVVYRGLPKEANKNLPSSPTGLTWFTSDKADAKDYSPDQMVAAYLSAKNIIDLDSTKAKSLLKKAGLDPFDLFALSEAGAKTKEVFQKAGYDGIVVSRPDIGSGVTHYAVFESTQIKSVDNRGTFDPNNPNILMQRGGGPQNLVALHNLSADKLLHADKMGGLAVPSLAISRTEHPLENFGDITLIGSSNLIDPRTKSNKVFNADIYSPRYPRVDYKVDHTAVFKLEPRLEAAKKYFEGNSDIVGERTRSEGISSMISDLEEKGKRGLDYNIQAGIIFAAENGLAKDATYQQYMDFRRASEDKFLAFKEEIGKAAIKQERIFKGFDYNGNRRYTAHTLENVVKELKKELQDGEGFNYGLGSLRSNVAKRYTTLNQIMADRGKVLSAPEFEKAKAIVEKEFEDIIDEARRKYTGKVDFGTADTFLANLKEGIKRGDIEKELSEYGFPGMDTERIKAFLSTIREMPTEYFEAKLQRAVGLNEFSGAIIPKSAPQSVRDALAKHGIPFREYEKENRAEVLRQFTQDLNNKGLDVLFQAPAESFGEITPQVPTDKGVKARAEIVKRTDAELDKAKEDYAKEVADSITVEDVTEEVLDPDDNPDFTQVWDVSSSIPDSDTYAIFKNKDGRFDVRNSTESKSYTADTFDKAVTWAKWQLEDSIQEESPSDEVRLADANRISNSVQDELVNTLVLPPGYNIDHIDHSGKSTSLYVYVVKGEESNDEGTNIAKYRISDHENGYGGNDYSIFVEGTTAKDYADGVDRLEKAIWKHAAASLGKDTYFQSAGRELAPTFYSKLQRTLEAKMPERASPAQIQGIIKDLKPEELKWSGIEDFLAGKDKVSKQELLDFLRGNQLEIKEVTKGETVRTLSYGSEVHGDEALAFISRGQDVFEKSDTNFSNPLSAGEIDPDTDYVLGEKQKEGSSPTKFSTYQLPGGENYREILFTLPIQKELPTEPEIIFNSEFKNWQVRDKNTRRVFGSGESREQAIERAKSGLDKSPFQSSHWDEPNVLAHTRVNDRVDADGKKVLFIEEIQSDWHQKGREEGYRDNAIDQKRADVNAKIRALDEEGKVIREKYPDLKKQYPNDLVGFLDALAKKDKRFGEIREERKRLYSESEQIAQMGTVPDAPFRNNKWVTFVLKRMIRYAAENGYDRIAWTTGEQQAERYDLSKQVDKIYWEKQQDGSYKIDAWRKDTGGYLFQDKEIIASELPNLVGKELSQKIVNSQDTHAVIRNADLKIGGEGMRSFYDQIIPNILNDLVDKFGAKVGETGLNTGAETYSLYNTATGSSVGGGYTKSEAEAKVSKNPHYTMKRESGGDTSVHSLDITPSLKEAALYEGFSLFQKKSKAPRGFYDPSENIIGLLKNKNASTFMHESAHYWLKDIFDFVKSGQADEEYLKRWEPMRKFLSISDLQTTLTRSQQEMFARHLEAYLMEGKAPSLELRDVFASFRQWLTRIYKTIKRLAAEAGFSVEVTPEVQDFFDHLFATEQEIEAARAETGLNEAASLSPDQAVEELRKQAHNAAVDALTKSVMKELKADYQKERQAYRAKFTKEEENRIRKYPAYAAMETLRNSKAFRGKDPFYEAGLYLNGGLTDEGRAQFDAIAMMLGHEDGYPLARLITEAEPFSEVLADHVEQEMAAKYGNMTEAPDFHEKAIEAVHNDRQLELMALEREILRGMTGEQDEKAVRKPLTEVTRRAANVEAKVIKRRAADILADKTYRDASQYRIFLTAEKNAAIALGRALAKKDITAATLAKQHQMFNHALAMESLRIRGQGEAVAEALMKAGDKTEKLPSSGKLPITAAANVQINRLLARFGFADPVNVPEGTPSLAQYVEEQQGHADEVVVADWLMGDTAPVVNWKDLSINQLLDLKDAIASLKQAGKRENTLSTGESLDEVVGSFVSEIYANGKVKPGDYDPARQHTAGDVAAKFVNSHRSLAYIMRALDGRKFGKLSAFVMGRLRKARHNESVMGAEAMQKVEALWDKHYPAEGDVPFKKWKKRTDMATAREFFEDPAINAIFPKGVTKENLIMMALNQGTELNKQRLLESYAMKSVDEEGNPTWQYRLTQDDVDKILSRLDKNDWDFVQGVLDLVNSYWPKIAELERNRTGLEPRKREAATIHTPFGSLPGGYFHIEYDPFASEPANRQTLEDSMKGAIEGSHIVPSTRRGHTKETVTHVYQRPLLLQFSVIDRHLQAVIHDLAFIETIRDLDRVLTNPDVTQAIKETKGDIAYRQIRPALAYIGFENRPQASPIDAMLSGIRARASAYYLMFRVTSILSQIAGMGVAMGSVGAHKYVGNLITMTPDKARMILDKSRIMRERLGNRDRDVRDAMRSFMEKGKLNGVTKYGFFLQGYMDIAVAMPQWMAAYENELQRQAEAGEQANEDRAITVADETVQSTQGSGDPIDQSAMQRGSEFMKLLTMFYTPFAPLANKQIELWEGLRENGIKDVPEVLSFLSFWIVLPGIMAAALSGDLPDGDDDDNSWFTWIIRNSLAQFFGGWIGARDMASYVSNKATGKNMGYRLTPVEAVVEKGLEPMVDAFKGNATADPADFAKGAANTAMLWFKLPGRQIDITVGYLVDLMSGNAEFEPRRLIYPEKKK